MLWGCEVRGSQLLPSSSGHRCPHDASALCGEGRKKQRATLALKNKRVGGRKEGRKGPSLPEMANAEVHPAGKRSVF